jgi:hypothetical protein
MAHRVVTYLSDEQAEVFARVRVQLGWDEATALRNALKYFVIDNSDMFGDWPKNDPERGGKREGAGRPPKDEGVQE